MSLLLVIKFNLVWLLICYSRHVVRPNRAGHPPKSGPDGHADRPHSIRYWWLPSAHRARMPSTCRSGWCRATRQGWSRPSVHLSPQSASVVRLTSVVMVLKSSVPPPKELSSALCVAQRRTCARKGALAMPAGKLGWCNTNANRCCLWASETTSDEQRQAFLNAAAVWRVLALKEQERKTKAASPSIGSNGYTTPVKPPAPRQILYAESAPAAQRWFSGDATGTSESWTPRSLLDARALKIAHPFV